MPFYLRSHSSIRTLLTQSWDAPRTNLQYFVQRRSATGSKHTNFSPSDEPGKMFMLAASLGVGRDPSLPVPVGSVSTLNEFFTWTSALVNGAQGLANPVLADLGVPVPDGSAFENAFRMPLAALVLMPRWDTADYPGGTLSWPKDYFEVTAARVDLGWKDEQRPLKATVSYHQYAKEVYNFVMDKSLPAIAAAQATFSSYEEMVAYGSKTNDSTYFSALVSPVGGGTIHLVGPNRDIPVYAVGWPKDWSSLEAFKDNPIHFPSWHTVGTASAASDPHTLQVVPGLMIGDASGLVGPTTNNVMASVAALGYYMAEKAAHL